MQISHPEKELLKKVLKSAQAKKIKLYIVGGYLRDYLLKRKKNNPDIDFCLKNGAINFGRKLAREMRAGFVVLDKAHGACRVVKSSDEKIYTLDFTDFRGRDLESDLLKRDFTINTLCLELEKAFLPNIDKSLIDPSCARADLETKIIRVVNKKSFDDDPLRILRAFSFACIFGFKIDKTTLTLIKLKKKKIAKVSFERIRDELFKVLETPYAASCFCQLDKLKILEIIFPEIKIMRGVGQGPYHHLDVWEHTLETLRQLEGVFSGFKNRIDIEAYLNQIISPERSRRALIKLGAFLHDIGKPDALIREDGKIIFHGHERLGLDYTENIAKRLKLSNDELAILKKMVFSHLRPGYLADNDDVTERAKFRYFRDTQDEAVGILLLSLADQRATRGKLTTKESRGRHERLVDSLIRRYFQNKKEKKLVRLINGDDLIKEFKLEPSPLIGEILREIEELQAIGKIKTKQEALVKVKRLIKGKNNA